jgi:Putative transposase
LDADRIVGHELGADADLQGAALHLFLRVVDQCLRAQSPGAGTSARLGAVAFIHRVGSTLNPHLHLHCVVIDGVIASDPAGGVIFHAATGLDANAIAVVQECVRLRLLRTFVRRGLLPDDDAQAMEQWAHGGGFSVNASVRIEANDRAGRELDPERFIYDNPKADPGARAALILTPLELLDRTTALVPPPRIHRHRCFGALARTAAYGKFPLRTRTAGGGRTRPLTNRD